MEMRAAAEWYCSVMERAESSQRVEFLAVHTGRRTIDGIRGIASNHGGFQEDQRCRRRDSNPRHADYDSACRHVRSGLTLVTLAFGPTYGHECGQTCHANCRRGPLDNQVRIPVAVLAFSLGLPHGRLTGPEDPDPDGVSTFRTHEQRPAWAPSISRGQRCSPRLATITSPRPSHHSDTSLHPAATIHRCEAPVDETSTRVQAIHPSGLPLACSPRMEQGPLGIPPSSAPRPHERRTSGRGQATEHGPKQRSMSST